MLPTLPPSARPDLLRLRFLGLFIFLAAAAFAPAAEKAAAPAAKAKGPARWEATIAAFEAADKTSPPAKGGVLLVGGSNARRWTDVATYFPGHAVLNRGFGGAQLTEVLHFADRLILPLAPATVILNAGGNDLSAGKSPEAVRDACRALAAKIRAALPQTRILAVSIPPTLRASKSPESLALVRRTNTLLAELAAQDPAFVYIDLFTAFLGADGQPRAELYVADGTHFTAAGYAILADLLRPKL